MPLYSSIMPNVRRGRPSEGSADMMAISMPMTPASRPLAMFFSEEVTITTIPTNANRNISAGPNFSAIWALGLMISSAISAAITPPTQDAVNEIPSANVALPCCASGKPSMVVAPAPVVPGVLNKMAGMEPPYWHPTYTEPIKTIAPETPIPSVIGSKMAVVLDELSPGTLPANTPIVTPIIRISRF